MFNECLQIPFVRWAILCFYWHLAVRRTRMENLTERPGQPKFRNDSYSSLTQLTAWGVPALQTVAVLVSRFVDADELLERHLEEDRPEF
uniref:Frizzled/Smoothened 7TM domain-containing protein n=1 Tax=Phlebotomus papatasi TaxID=29031 RepID=A0A1B0D5H7_PHLPP